MIPTSKPFHVQEAYFRKHGIDTRIPGFYDHPCFLKLEKSNPEFLNSYASYVSQQEYNEGYLVEAKRKIGIISALLYDELVRDGRLGACVDMSMTLSKILEEEGIWNYAMKGSLTIRFNNNLGLRDKYFYSADNGEFVAGHAWVVAPPFKIIDLTLNQQPGIGIERRFIPKYMLSAEFVKEIFDIGDIINPLVLPDLRHRYGSEASVIKNVFLSLAVSPDLFFPFSIAFDTGRLKYMAVGMGVPDVGLKEMGGLVLNGKKPFRLYQEYIKPAVR